MDGAEDRSNTHQEVSTRKWFWSRELNPERSLQSRAHPGTNPKYTKSLLPVFGPLQVSCERVAFSRWNLSD